MNKTLYGLSLTMFLALPLSSLAAEYEAKVEWNRKVTLGTAVSGVVQEVQAQPGQVVAKDTLLLSLDTKVFTARLAQQEAEFAAQQKQFEEAARELERAQNYYDQDLSSTHELEMAKVQHAMAEAGFKAAEAELAQARHDLNHASIRAPFDGVVIARHVEVGQVVVSDETAPALLEFAEVGRQRAVAGVSAAVLRRLKVGNKASLSYAGKNLRAEVQGFGYEPLPGKKAQYPVYVLIETKNSVIPVGTTVKLQLP